MELRIDISPKELARIIRRALSNRYGIDEGAVKVEYDGELPGLVMKATETVE